MASDAAPSGGGVPGGGLRGRRWEREALSPTRSIIIPSTTKSVGAQLARVNLVTVLVGTYFGRRGGCGGDRPVAL